MPPVGFEHTTSAGERPQNHALDRTGTGTGTDVLQCKNSGSKQLNVAVISCDVHARQCCIMYPLLSECHPQRLPKANGVTGEEHGYKYVRETTSKFYVNKTLKKIKFHKFNFATRTAFQG
jgi:hypothetical protein